MHTRTFKRSATVKKRHLLLPVTAILVAQVPQHGNSQTAGLKKVGLQVNNPRRGDIKIRFVDTDVSEVLQALGVRTKDNIVYAGQGKKLISINVNASSTEEALRYITAAAGLAFRQAGNSYVVAPAASLKQAIEPLGDQARVPLTSLVPAAAVKVIEDAFPYVTARPAGSQVLLIGAASDLQQAQALLREQDALRTPDPARTEVIAVQNVVPAQAVNVLKSLYPELKIEAIGDAAKPGGSIGLAGPRSIIERARQSLSSIDATALPKEPDRTYRIYNIKYSSSRVLRAFLQSAAPNVTVLTGPESYSPPRPSFNPITGAALGTASSSIGGSSTGGQTTGGTGSEASGGASNLDTAAQNANAGGVVGANASTSNGRGGVNDRAKTLVLSGTPGEIAQVLALLEQVDTPPRQVMVEVKVVDVSPSFVKQLGVQYQYAPIAVGNYTAGSTIDPTNGAVTTTNSGNFNSATFSRLGPGFGAQISALISRTNSKMLADPRVQVTDNDDASIFIGDTVRTQISQSGIAGTTIQVLEFPVGIILLVRPRVNADGHITMRVHPVVSTITSLSAGNIPQTSNREADTTVMVQDGETIIIGGLIRDDVSRTVSEVPLLSKLPLVGELFKYRAHNRTRSEVMVFITPHLNYGMTEAEQANSKAKVIEDTRLTIPNPKGSKLPEDLFVNKGKKP